MIQRYEAPVYEHLRWLAAKQLGVFLRYLIPCESLTYFEIVTERVKTFNQDFSTFLYNQKQILQKQIS